MDHRMADRYPNIYLRDVRLRKNTLVALSFQLSQPHHRSKHTRLSITFSVCKQKHISDSTQPNPLTTVSPLSFKSNILTYFILSYTRSLVLFFQWYKFLYILRIHLHTHTWMLIYLLPHANTHMHTLVHMNTDIEAHAHIPRTNHTNTKYIYARRHTYTSTYILQSVCEKLLYWLLRTCEETKLHRRTPILLPWRWSHSTALRDKIYTRKCIYKSSTPYKHHTDTHTCYYIYMHIPAITYMHIHNLRLCAYSDIQTHIPPSLTLSTFRKGLFFIRSLMVLLLLFLPNNFARNIKLSHFPSWGVY